MRVAPYFLGLLINLFAGASTANEVTTVLERLREGHHPDHSRLVFDLSSPVEYDVLRRKAPERVIVELQNTHTELTTGDLATLRSPFDDIEIVVPNESTIHIVFGIPQSARTEVFPLKPYLSRGDRLVIDFFDIRSGFKGIRSERSGNENKTAGYFHDRRERGEARSVVDPISGEVQGEPANGPMASAMASAKTDNAVGVEFGGIWEQEWAVETAGGGQKFEAVVEPRLDLRFSNNSRLTAIGRLRLDTMGDLGPQAHKPDNYSSINGPWYNDAHAEFSLRELYFDLKWRSSYWRIGKQQVIWGEADGIKVLDVVNPQSFREFILDDFDDSRIPLNMVNVEFPVGEDITVQLLWIPDPTTHELADSDTPFFITSPLLVPTAPDGLEVDIKRPRRPNNLFEDGDVGGRLSGFAGGWDFSLNYLYHYQDFPVLYQYLDSSEGGFTGSLVPEYERNHLAGGTLSNAFGDLTFRGELAYSTDSFHISNDLGERGIGNSSELAYVLGLDWQLVDYDSWLSLQWFQSHLFDYDSAIERDQTENNVTLFYQRDFANETWSFDGSVLYSVNHSDWLMQLQLRYMWLSNLEVWLGADIFSGNREGMYGQFKDEDRVLLGLKLGF